MEQSLKPQQLYILLSLAGGDRHGSGVMREVLDLSDRRFRLWPAMLYNTLDQLTDDGWIRELKGNERPSGASERRRYFRITNEGRRVLTTETERLYRLVEVSRLRNPLSAEEPA